MYQKHGYKALFYIKIIEKLETKPRILHIILNIIVEMIIQLDQENWYSDVFY